MKIRLLLTWLFMASVTFSLAQGKKVFQSLLAEIDQAIEQFPEIVGQYERQIEETRQQYLHARQPEEKYELAFDLYERYKSFMNDSALYYLSEAMHWAEESGRREGGWEMEGTGWQLSGAEGLPMLHRGLLQRSPRLSEEHRQATT